MHPSSASFDVQVMFLDPFVQGVMQAVQLFLEQQFMFLIYIDLLLTEYRLRTPRLRRDFRRDAQWADYVRRLPKGCLLRVRGA